MKRKFCPVGKLLPEVKVAILDENNAVQPIGIAGEVLLILFDLDHAFHCMQLAKRSLAY